MIDVESMLTQIADWSNQDLTMAIEGLMTATDLDPDEIEIYNALVDLAESRSLAVVAPAIEEAP